jgi:hypothetical protein
MGLLRRDEPGKNAEMSHFPSIGAPNCAKSHVVTAESSTDFVAPWASVTIPNSATSSPFLTVVKNGTAPDDITVVIPASGAPRKFARVKVEIPVTP